MALTPQPAGALHRVRLKAFLGAVAGLTAGLVAALALVGTPVQAQTAAPTAVVVWDFDNQTPGALQSAASTDFLKRSRSEERRVGKECA